jgi:hypothetical protein
MVTGDRQTKNSRWTIDARREKRKREAGERWVNIEQTTNSVWGIYELVVTSKGGRGPSCS